MNKGLTGRRENGGRRGLREREGEVQRREPDLGAVLVPPNAARNCTKETSQSSCNRNGRGRDHPTPHQIEPFHSAGRKADPPRFPAIPIPSGAEEGSAESCARVLVFRRRKRERPAGDGDWRECVRACEVRKKSGRRRSALGLMEQAGSAPHVSGRFEESADIIEYGHMAEWRIAGDN